MRSGGASISADCESSRSHHRVLPFEFRFSVMSPVVSVPIISVPPPVSDVKLISLAKAVKPYLSYTHWRDTDGSGGRSGTRDGRGRSRTTGPPRPSPAGDDPRDPRDRPRRHGRGGGERPQLGGGGAPSGRPA